MLAQAAAAQQPPSCPLGNAFVAADDTVWVCRGPEAAPLQVATSAGAAAWGGITGTLANQTDLQTTLDGKLATNGNGGSLTGLTKTQVGLANVENTALSTWTGSANVTTLSAAATLTTTGSVGYRAGAGGTVTQLTNKSTGVTLNKQCGAITMNGAALAAAAEVNFTVTNNTIAAGDVVIVNHVSAGTLGAYAVFAMAPTSGSFRVMVGNMSAGSLSEAIVIGFCKISGVTS